MSLTDVLPVEPVIPTSGQPISRRQARARACRRAQRVVGGEDPARRRARRVELGGARAGRRRRPRRPARAPRRRSGRRRLVLPGKAEEEIARREPRASRSRRARASRLVAARDGSRRRPRRRSARARARSRVRPARRRAARSSSRATSRSSNGILRPSSNSWPCSWPLPAITTRSPGARPAERGGDRARGGRARRRRFAAVRSATPSSIWAMIASGSSERGLSEVTTGRSESSRAGPRPSAAASADRDRRRSRRRRSASPSVSLRGRAEHVLERVGRVGVVDEHAEVLALVDRLHPARDGLGAGKRRRRPSSRSTPSAGARPSAARAFSTLKWPGQPQVAPRRRSPRRLQARSVRARRVELDVVGAQVGVGAGRRERRQARPADPPELGGEALRRSRRRR